MSLPCLPGFRREPKRASFARATTLGDEQRLAARPLSAQRAPPLSSREPAFRQRPLSAMPASRSAPRAAPRADRPSSAPRQTAPAPLKRDLRPVSAKGATTASVVEELMGSPTAAPSVSDAMATLEQLATRYPAGVKTLRECLRELDLSRSGRVGEDEFMDALDMAYPGALDDDMRFALAEALFPEATSQVGYRQLLDDLSARTARRATAAETGVPMAATGKPKLAPLNGSKSRMASYLRTACESARSDEFAYSDDEDDDGEVEEEPLWSAAGPATPGAGSAVPPAWEGGWTPRSVESGSEYSDLSARSDMSWASSGASSPTGSAAGLSVPSPLPAPRRLPSPVAAGRPSRHEPYNPFAPVPSPKLSGRRPSSGRTSASMLAATGHFMGY